MRLLTTSEYLEVERPQLEWIVDQQIPNPGLILLQGPAKAGKSFLAFDLARCVSQGAPFLGWKTKESRCLFLQFDTSEMIWRQRLLHMKTLGVNLTGQLYTVHPEDMKLPINILNHTDRAWLAEVVKQCDPTLTVIDIFREIHNADENDSTQMKIVGDILMQLFKERCLVLVHHTKKIPEDFTGLLDPSQVARGSSYLTGKVDSLWLLYHNQLHIQGRTSEQQRVKLIQSPSGLWEIPKNLPASKGDLNALLQKS